LGYDINYALWIKIDTDNVKESSAAHALEHGYAMTDTEWAAKKLIL